jgi:hypothetical protein
MRAFFLFSFSILLSCGSKPKVPKGILPMPQMTDVLWDVMRADEMVSLQYPLDTGTIRFDTSLILYRQIAKQRNTTQQQFRQSLQFYKDRPDLMQVIIDSLAGRATLPPVAIDSIRKDPVAIQ